MRVSNKLKTRINTIFWITVAWTIVSLFQFLIGYVTILELRLDLGERDPMVSLKTALITGILAGVLGGSGVVFLWEKWLRTKPYGWTLKRILVSYLVIFLMVAIPANLFFQVNTLGLSVLNITAWEAAFNLLFSLAALIPFFYWLLVVIATLIVLLVNDKYGPGVFRKFLMGKYFNAKREERVFMFLDLRSSTTIAEKLGEEKYFSFLKEVFEDATPGILKYKGEIYQYVGDEIVISWNIKSGIENANCIQCYFEIQSLLAHKKQFFIEKYGEVPEFKAGLHYGHVMAGEIGVVKREIAFSGDVLNTTARIQSKCNELGVNILASKFLIEKLGMVIESFHPKEIGEMELRGKKELVTLYTL